MNKKNALDYCRKKVEEHPDLKEQIVDLYILFLDEIENGSESHEYNLLVGSVEELIEGKSK